MYWQNINVAAGDYVDAGGMVGRMSVCDCSGELRFILLNLRDDGLFSIRWEVEEGRREWNRSASQDVYLSVSLAW